MFIDHLLHTVHLYLRHQNDLVNFSPFKKFPVYQAKKPMIMGQELCKRQTY